MALDRPQPQVVTTMTANRPATQGYAFPQVTAPQRPVIVGVVATRRRRFLNACISLAQQAGRLSWRYRYELAPAWASGAVTGLGWLQYIHGAGPGTIAIESLLGLICTGAGYLGMKHKHEHIAHGGAGFALFFGDLAANVATGPGVDSAVPSLVFTGAAYAFYIPWLTQRRHERMKLNLDTVKAKGAVPAAMGVEMADPGLVGSSTEETALRRAIYALVGATPLDVPVFQFNDNGWAALVTMPAGRNTGPDAIVRKKDQFAANLGLPGTLHVKKGDNDNQLLVRLVTSDALAGTIPFEDDGYASMADPARLGRDEHGNPVEITVLYRHTLIAGASDWGKSGIMNLIIKRMTRRGDVDLYGIDMKPGSVELGPWEPLMKKVAKGIEEARDLLQFIRAECDRRGAYLAELSARELAAGRPPVRKWIPGVHGNGIVVFVDELAELIRQDEALRKLEAEWRKQDKESYPLEDPVAVTHESLLAIARFLAITFVEATQQPSRKVFGGSTDARGNYANRICTRMGESGHAQFIFGSDARGKGWRPEELDLPGKFMVQTPELENQDPRKCRAEYVSDEDIAADVSHLYARFQFAEQPPFLDRPRIQDAAPTQSPWAPKAPTLLYPDGTPVDVQPDLYRVFLAMGSATKEELTDAGPFDSRDTVRRALDAWQEHGVLKRKEGRAERFFLPDNEEDAA